MYRLGNLAITILPPVALGNSRNHCLYSGVLIGPNREHLAGLFAAVEDTGLIGRAVGAHRPRLHPRGQASFTALHDLEVPGRRSCVAIAKLVPCH
jgi:hypothetical protein